MHLARDRRLMLMQMHNGGAADCAQESRVGGKAKRQNAVSARRWQLGGRSNLGGVTVCTNTGCCVSRRIENLLHRLLGRARAEPRGAGARPWKHDEADLQLQCSVEWTVGSGCPSHYHIYICRAPSTK